MTWISLRTTRWRWPVPDRRTIGWAAAILATEALLVFVYLATTGTAITEPRYAVYPFVWIDLGLWAMVRTHPRIRSRRGWALAAGIAGVYVLTLFYAGGLFRLDAFGAAGTLGTGTELRLGWVLPGWGPMVVYRNSWLQAVVVPFKLVGYLSIAYLVYARLLDATKISLSGVFGLISCVGCTFSVLLPLVGATALFGTTVTNFSWDLSTVVFVVTVLLLYYGERIERAAREHVRTHTSTGRS